MHILVFFILFFVNADWLNYYLIILWNKKDLHNRVDPNIVGNPCIAWVYKLNTQRTITQGGYLDL